MPDFTWDANTARYRNERGSFVSTNAVIDQTNQRIDDGAQRLENFLSAIAGGRGNVNDLQDAVITELKNQHIQAAMLGRGGRDAMTQADYGRLGATLRQEYKFMRRFIEQAANGELSEAQIKNRLKMYSSGVWKSQQAGERSAHKAAGYTHKRRVLDPSAETCGDCEEYARIGWVPIDDKSLPDPGKGSICKSNCRCHWEFKIEGRQKRDTAPPDIDPLKPPPIRDAGQPGTAHYDRARNITPEFLSDLGAAPPGDDVMGHMFGFLEYDPETFTPRFNRGLVDDAFSDLQYEIYKIGRDNPRPDELATIRTRSAAILAAYDQRGDKFGIANRNRLQRLAFGDVEGEMLDEINKIKDNRIRTRGSGGGSRSYGSAQFMSAADADGAARLLENRMGQNARVLFNDTSQVDWSDVGNW